MVTNISGFPELLPREQIAFNRVVQIIKQQFELHGFTPIDTPAVERASTLLAKGNDSEIYGIHRLADEGGSKEKDLALRFDLTVPLARYVAQHYGQLTFPYKRYHIAPVWRGERPQAGRYRQFYQCDIDIIGDGELPLIYDAEALSIIYKVFKQIGLERFVIKINNRFLLTGLLKSFGAEEETLPTLMRIIDKADKISRDALSVELEQQGLPHAHITLLLDLLEKNISNKAWLEYLPTICNHPEFITGLEELSSVLHSLKAFGVEEQHIKIDAALARGLNYYTGTISETKLLDYPELGSICGGGRYANLAESFSNKRLPGVGMSIGISRLIPKLIEAGIIKADMETPASVLVTTQNQSLMNEYIKIAQLLRDNGVNTDIYLAPKPLAAQMKYANKKGFVFAIIADEAELREDQLILRKLTDGSQQIIKITELSESIISST